MASRDEILRDRLVHTRRSIEQNDLPALEQWLSYWEVVMDFENVRSVEGRVVKPLMQTLVNGLESIPIVSEVDLRPYLLHACDELKEALWATPSELEQMLWVQENPIIYISTEWKPLF